MRTVLGQQGFLFVEHGNRAFHEFVDGLVGAALHVLLNQIRELRPKSNFHARILLHLPESTLLGRVKGRVPRVSPPLRDMGAYATTDTSPCGLRVGRTMISMS